MPPELKLSTLMLTLLTFLIISTTNAQTKPMLKFNENGKFKIVQFTDIHLKVNEETEKRDSSLAVMRMVLDEEKPDLVVLTGDIAISEEVEAAWDSVTAPMIERKIPWAVVFGNHDYEHGWTNAQIMKYLQTLPYNLSVPGPDEVSGTGNYVLEVHGSKSNDVKSVLYCLDSHSYTGAAKKDSTLGYYAWISFDQIAWYRGQSANYTKMNGGTPMPALSFFHIPFPEYNNAWGLEKTVGVKNEDVCSPALNSGLYLAMVECKDVMGTFVGHDHVNDYIGCFNNICLAYGCCTGLQAYGDLPKGGRVIELYEGEHKFDTWLHNTKYDKQYFVSYPQSFE